MKAVPEELEIATSPTVNEAARAPGEVIGEEIVERDYSYEDVSTKHF